MITMQRVRELAGQHHQPAVTSVYLDVDGRRNPRPIDVERHFKDMRKQIEERIESERDRPPPALSAGHHLSLFPC